MDYRKLLLNVLVASLPLASNAGSSYDDYDDGNENGSFPFTLSSKTSRDSVCMEATLNTYSINFDKVVPVVEQYINENSLLINSKTQNYEQVYYNVVMTEAQYNAIKQQLEGWKCAVLNSTETTKNLSREIENQSVSIERLKSDIKELETRITKVKNDSIAEELESELYDKRESLRKKNRNLSEGYASIGTVNLNFYLMRDETSPRQTKVRFVNMPGFEYSFLMVGNPKPGFSASYYNGYNLKYLFTRGKTFITLGVFKAKDVAATDSTTLTDAFNISFGQDFYSRHFGRGARKCFNMYSGYNVGFMAFRGETTSTKTIYVSPTVGVELFKNRFVLWDLRGSYYLPFKHNYDLRGWQFSTSFNVAF